MLKICTLVVPCALNGVSCADDKKSLPGSSGFMLMGNLSQLSISFFSISEWEEDRKNHQILLETQLHIFFEVVLGTFFKVKLVFAFVLNCHYPIHAT